MYFNLIDLFMMSILSSYWWLLQWPYCRKEATQSSLGVFVQLLPEDALQTSSRNDDVKIMEIYSEGAGYISMQSKPLQCISWNWPSLCVA